MFLLKNDELMKAYSIKVLIKVHLSRLRPFTNLKVLL
jgi:hypothetical protein